MKATITRSALANALTAMSPAIPTRPQVPVLAAVRLKLTGDTLTLSGTDLELTIIRSVEVEGHEDGVSFVSALRLRDLVSAFSGTKVELESDSDAGLLRIRCGRSTYALSELDGAVYPKQPKLPPRRGRADAHALHAAMKSIAHASKGELDTVLGVFVETFEGALCVAATDRYQLGVAPIAYEGEDVALRMLASTALTKNLTGTFSLHADDRVAAFVCDDATVIVRQISGDGANWKAVRSVLPDAPTVTSTDELLQALKRAALTIDDKGNVHVGIAHGIAVVTGSGEVGSGGEEVDVEDDTTAEFRIQPGRLIPILSSISEDRVEVGASTNAGKPLRFRGVDIDGQFSATEHVLMPVRVV